MTHIADRPADTIPTGAELVDRIRALQPMLAKNSAQGEADRRVVEESITALAEAGVFKIAQPKRYGGYETSMRTMLDVSAAVAEADGGTAWVVTLCNVCAWVVGLFPQQAQDDVWADTPDAKVCGVITPTSETTKVDGGYRVTGRWYYNSGSWHADWATMGVPITDESGAVVDQGMALIPRSDLKLEETWFVAGMRASGSNCMVAEDVFVPEHRVLSVPPLIEGHYGTEHTDETLYRSALVPILALVLAGPQLGLGRRALEIVQAKAATKPISYTHFAAQSDSVGFQLQLAEAAMRIETAHLHAYRAADDIDTAAAQGGYPDQLARARVRADTAWVLDNVTRAIDILLFAHGAGSFAEVNPLQRIWRDSAVAARHAVTLPTVNYEIYGKALLRRDDQITPLI
ncbi:acyl-CoA dehydrogenase family protein [Amycolatopsis endophytica]|uniref:Alkylation response protein AidB-like acyl-CoA dehydrogenase n=1 Tax=Amycolatopsis endophytica TaxID=860233 RepID=A0A853BE98_9PSEU|nr:acyl-CoA dehydrogenase family protein [Amycolatopsis endophytica]NYI93002.1 alkylation response protein AidB-like acyl-CoA dehydrogenase [Amycolatopsis endophytica]